MTRTSSAPSIALLAAVGFVLQASAAVAAAPAETGLEEVTVTAQRVSERLQEVPLSVTSLSATELEDRQISSGLDVVRQVPNLLGSNNVGLGSAASFFLRGVGQDESIATSDPAVGVYVDGVYIRGRSPTTCSCTIWNASKCCVARKAPCTAATPPVVPSNL
jgi:iron complex outermembrane receptor protein